MLWCGCWLNRSRNPRAMLFWLKIVPGLADASACAPYATQILTGRRFCIRPLRPCRFIHIFMATSSNMIRSGFRAGFATGDVRICAGCGGQYSGQKCQRAGGMAQGRREAGHLWGAFDGESAALSWSGFWRAVGVNMQVLPYRGTAPAVNDVAAGQLPLAVVGTGDLAPLHNAENCG